MGLARKLSLLGSLALLLGCRSSSSPHCPQGMQVVAAKTTEGRSVFCQTADGKRSQWVLMHEKTGGKRQSCAYAEGRPEGSFTAWHPSGKVWVQGQYVAGKKARTWKQWDDSGHLVAEGDYREGRLVGGAPVGGIATCESAPGVAPK